MKVSDDAMLADLNRLLAERESQPATGDPGFSCAELRKIIGKSDMVTRRFIAESLADGKMIQGRRLTRAIDGVMRWQAVYRPANAVEVRTK